MDQTFSLHPLSQATSPFNAYNPNGVWHMDGESAQGQASEQAPHVSGPSIYAGRPDPHDAAFILPLVVLVGFAVMAIRKVAA